jgi:hypothetical protein
MNIFAGEYFSLTYIRTRSRIGLLMGTQGCADIGPLACAEAWVAAVQMVVVGSQRRDSRIELATPTPA